jgi:hypothetical protein
MPDEYTIRKERKKRTERTEQLEIREHHARLKAEFYEREENRKRKLAARKERKVRKKR